ncbi:MAG TPA: beta-propeller fold lactonase family protein [Acidobacteriaceae bacterium]|nr:beta-propeller fold lactonase family protein [Acidobacteriaceae bacterium]
MKVFRVVSQLSGVAAVLLAGCGQQGPGSNLSPSTPTPGSQACTPAVKPEFAYVLTGYSVSIFGVDTCSGQFSASTPASIATGNPSAEEGAEEMVVDPLGRFAYVANLVSNASDLATISMYTVNPSTGVLTPTTPATVPTGFFPQEIAVDPLGRFVYTANSDDSSVSMFTINQTNGVLTPTAPAAVSTMLPGQLVSEPGFLTVDPTGKFLYVGTSNSDGATVLMFNIDQKTGALTPTSPATVVAYGIPFQIVVTPSGKFAYAVNNLSGPGDGNAVSQYSVNSTTGVLTLNTSFAVTAGDGPTSLAVDPSSKYAYVVNRLDGTVSMYTINQTTGQLALNATAANPSGTVRAGALPFRINFDRTGRLVYVTNEDSPEAVFTVNNDGTLTSAGTTGVAGGAYATAFSGGD